MNRWVNNQLKKLDHASPPPSYEGIAGRKEFLVKILRPHSTIDDLDPNDAICVICQFSLCPIGGEPWPTEHPVRLPCGHFIGQTCAIKWFSSLAKGKMDADEDYNTGCPLCRHQMFDVEDTEDLKDDNRQRWTQLAKAFRAQVVQYQTSLPHEKAMEHVKARGGFGKILETLDRLALLRSYVFRHFEPNNLRVLNNRLLHTWAVRTQIARSSRHWVDELQIRDADAAKELCRRLNSAYQVSVPGQHVHCYTDEPEDRILKSYTHADMLPSRIWRRTVTACSEPGWFDPLETEKIKLQLLDVVTWAIRQRDAAEDFPGFSAEFV